MNIAEAIGVNAGKGGVSIDPVASMPPKLPLFCAVAKKVAAKQSIRQRTDFDKFNYIRGTSGIG